MPEYHYKCEACGARRAVVRRMAERRKSVTCSQCGRTMHRDIAAEHAGQPNTAGNWPMLSDAMGCHPDQIPEFERHSREIGVPTRFTPDGRAILESRRHRKRYGEALGYYDRNGGYGDPQRK